MRTIVDTDRFGGLTAYDTRRAVYGAERRVVLTHSPELRDSQARGFDGTTLAKAGKKLDELAATLARGKTRRGRDKVQAEIESITRKPWVRRVITWQLTGDQPKDLRLAWQIDSAARAVLEEELFGKHVLITSHDNWPVPEVVAGYRSQSEAGRDHHGRGGRRGHCSRHHALGAAAAPQPADGLRPADRVLPRPPAVRAGGGDRARGRVPPTRRGRGAARQVTRRVAGALVLARLPPPGRS